MFDYAFVKNIDEDDPVKCLIARMYPSRMTLAMVCDRKRDDPHAAQRLTTFVKERGVRQWVYKSDQERDIGTMVNGAIRQK